MEAHSDNPYLFIVGCPRSGTTLLERMINAHPQIAIIHETHWIARNYENRVGVTREGFVTKRLISKLCKSHRFSNLGVSREELEDLLASNKPITYANFVSRIFDLRGAHEGKHLVGDKTTGGYLRSLSVLNSLWPSARFIHVIRDGRDVCLSMLNWRKAHRAAGRYATWKQEPVATTALWWKWHVELGMQAGRPLGDDLYHELSYESFVENPADRCAAVCSFLDLPFDDAMLRFNEGQTSTEPGLSANRAWLPPTAGLRDWRSQMEPSDVEMFEAIAGDCLATLGYERAFDVISPEIAERAERCRGSWQQDGTETPQMTETRSRPSITPTSDGTPQTPSENPYVFIVGCPRSGTTLLKRMVNAHPQIAITLETHWITRFYKKRIGLTPDGLVTGGLIPKLFEYHRFSDLKIDRAEVEQFVAANHRMSYADFVSALFDYYGERKGKPFVGDKTPGYVRNIPLLHKLWPNARFVHLIRDARDVCLSMANWRMAPRAGSRFATWSDDPVSTAALWWKWHVRLGIEDGRPLGSDLYYEIQYESLVENPVDECEKLCTFLDIPQDDVMTEFHQGRTKENTELSANRAWLPATPGMRNWRSQMPPEDVQRVEAVVGDMLDKLGYPRAFDQPDPELMQRASKLDEQFSQDAGMS